MDKLKEKNAQSAEAVELVKYTTVADVPDSVWYTLADIAGAWGLSLGATADNDKNLAAANALVRFGQ